jgi:parallel beta-helix repeat protein
MIRCGCVGFLLCATMASGQQRALPTIELKPGLVITQSVRVLPRVYDLASVAPADAPIIVIRGDNITVDFAGAVLQGMPPDSSPDLGRGTAIFVDRGSNIRILNARARGYKVGILARGTTNLTLVDNDFSYNWKPRLFSVIEHESLVDWLSFHHNDAGEWLRYGAGIYLDSVQGGEVRGNTVRQGMNGLMLARSNGLTIVKNDFSFNSGVGIGLYRSAGNTIVHNRVDYNVRGYSEGFYRRGQDAANLLMYEQSDKNIVAYNSMTHGGDGLFLWAGQTTMDSGVGGANDNLFYGNDFSFAPANGIEATFSSNTFVGNRVEGSEYGAWAGYSYNSRFVGNDFRSNRTGIAIEHGQKNLIASNGFLGDSTAINIWADSITASDWGYPKHRDTRSKDYEINDNLFVGNRVGIRAASTAGLMVATNRFFGVDTTAAIHDSTTYTFMRNAVRERSSSAPKMPAIPAEFARLAPKPVPGGLMPLRPDTSLARKPRSAIVVDEWGAFDYRSPKVWPVDSARESPLRLRVIGPAGKWRVSDQRGVASLSRMEGKVGDTVIVTPKPDSIGDWKITLEYIGASVTSPRGEKYARGTPYIFSYERFEPRISWSIQFYRWTDSIADLRKSNDGFATLLKTPALFSGRVPRLDYEGYRPLPGLPRENFAIDATGSVDLPAGEYTLRTISDDGISVWVDGKLMIHNWQSHESAVDYAPLTGGHHELRVEYYQADGWYELRLDVLKGRDRSEGSPAPHGA